MLLQFYTILYETSVCAYVMALRYGYAFDKILKFCFCFLFCTLKLFHDKSYRQKVAGDINSLNLLFFHFTDREDLSADFHSFLLYHYGWIYVVRVVNNCYLLCSVDKLYNGSRTADYVFLHPHMLQVYLGNIMWMVVLKSANDFFSKAQYTLVVNL